MPDPSPSNADSLKFQLLTARKKEWWPATPDSLLKAISVKNWRFGPFGLLGLH